MSDHIKNFWNGLARKNPRDGVVGHYDAHNADEREAEYLFRKIELEEGNKYAVALDFGCGPGRNMIKFDNWFKRIDGADVSEVILECAKKELEEAGLSDPDRNLYLINGYDLSEITDEVYDVVFSIICMQHISDHGWRKSLFSEFWRVLKRGGWLTFQMGYGPGHPISVEYHYRFSDNEDRHRDVRIEESDVNYLKQDLWDAGFASIEYDITEPCNDQHPQWIWVRAFKND